MHSCSLWKGLDQVLSLGNKKINVVVDSFMVIQTFTSLSHHTESTSPSLIKIIGYIMQKFKENRNVDEMENRGALLGAGIYKINGKDLGRLSIP